MLTCAWCSWNSLGLKPPPVGSLLSNTVKVDFNVTNRSFNQSSYDVKSFFHTSPLEDSQFLDMFGELFKHVLNKMLFTSKKQAKSRTSSSES